MPYATPYDAQYNFYTGFPWDETQEGIWWNYPGLQFTVDTGGGEGYNIDPTTINQLRIPGAGDRDPWGTPLFTSSLTGQYVAPEALETLLQQASYVSGIPYQSIDQGKFEQDLAMYLQRSPYGIPVGGGRYGDNAGDGYSLGSLLSNEFVLAALATGAAVGGAAAFGAAAPAATAGGASGAVATGGAGGLGAGAAGLGGSGAAAGTIGAGAGVGGVGSIGAGTFGAGSALAGTAAGGAGGLGTGAAGGGFGGSGAVSSGGAAGGLGGAGGTAGGGGGLFGTGITAGQALTGGQLLATGIGALASGGRGGSSSGAGGAGGPAQDQQAANKEWARRLVTESIAPRLAQLGEGIVSLTQLANASPNALMQRLSPQIEQARDAAGKMFKQVSQRFGPMGGGQTEREQVMIGENIGRAIGEAFTALPGQAMSALGRIVENFQTTPQPPAQIMQTNLGTKAETSPFNPASVFSALQQGAGLGTLAQRVDNYIGAPGGVGGNYGGISQGVNTQALPYDYGISGYNYPF